MARTSLHDLLAETRWLSGLARALVGNEHDAADLVQDTLCAAARRPPRTGGDLRRWLRAVLKNRWRDRLRAQSARLRREHANAPEPLAAPTIDVVAKAEAQRQLVAAVLALAEPFRTCLLLRFFEDLPPRAIAARTAAPLATVNSRLQRGLAMLRTQLAARDGERWPAVLAPLAAAWPGNGAPAAPPLASTGRVLPGTLLLGASTMPIATKIAAAAAATIALAFYLLNDVDRPPAAPARDRDSVASPAPASAAVAADPVARTADPPTERRALAAPTAVPPALEPDGTRHVRGRVLDVTGRALADVALCVGGSARDAQPLGRSGPDGRFEVDVPTRAQTIVAADARWATVLAGAATVRAENACAVVLAPRIDLAGRVVDERGAPLAAAAIVVHVPSHLGAELGLVLDFSVVRTWRTESDTDGRFRLGEVPTMPQAMLEVSLGGFLPHLQPVPPASDELLAVTLARPRAGASLVDGVVVDPLGAAVAAARVSAGAAIAVTDTAGRFRLDVSGRSLRRIVAVAPGMQAAVFMPPATSDPPQWPERIVLQLGAAPLAIGGRVVFADGRAAAGVRVWIADPTVVGQGDDTVLAESLHAAPAAPFWNFVRADATGAFRLDGLQDRSYRVRAMDDATLSAVEVADVRAGRTDVELRITGALLPAVRGRIVTRDGTPLAGVKVQLQRPALEVAVPGGTRDEWHARPPVETDAQGRFVFRDVPDRDVEVFAFGDAILFAGKMLTAGAADDDFELVVERRRHLQVELAPPFERADAVRLLDDAGNAMVLRVMRGDSSYTSTTARLRDGRTEVLSLGERATTAVLLLDGTEVARVPVTWSGDEVTTVRF